ncbi:hypothetical protein NDU88_004072 [Pleurodeles waltl]|uniref:Uncharacterized protein n=1 Tax=Pleurodeles waltl TaxID=8319 RepID=A0AAV7RER2_PLEWA|nr:hypothetical protein NDU88_004072 [Pleurodeles waltl]
MARVSGSDRLDVPPDSTFGFSDPSKLGDPANSGSARYSAGGSGTGAEPGWSSAGQERAQRGFPFGGIRAEPVSARLPGRSPGSQIVRLRTCFHPR